MGKPRIAVNPKHPERLCWGCEKLCAANDLRCGNGTIRTQHPLSCSVKTGPNGNSTLWAVSLNEETQRKGN